MLLQFMEEQLNKVILEKLIGIILKKPCSIDKLPGFKEGEVSIQDCGAQLTAKLLRLQPNHRVLDACAAPGGKTTHILENQPNIAELIAIDIKSDRLKKVAENLQRLHFKASLICEDILNTSKWWDGKLFDRILLDAPCSATGVINRHPDIKILRKKADIKKNSFYQLQLIEALWKTLKPHGELLYITCSVFPDENENVIHTFLASHNDAKEEKIIANWGITKNAGRQLLPHLKENDGFYFARLKKINL